MTANDIFLIVTWVVGIAGAIISARNARKRIRVEAQIILDKASFEGAQLAVDIMKEQLTELRTELKIIRGEISAMRAREGKLLNRIKTLEVTLLANNIIVPKEES